eukprot:4069883-Prorocentrum_lima.AAC.1
MTSSLVGSEMCIRDSPMLEATCGRTPPPAHLDQQPSPVTETAFDFHGPVSYTHLTLPTICSV